MSRARLALGWGALLAACGASPGPAASGPPSDDAPAGVHGDDATAEDDGPQCSAPAEVEHPTYRSATLHLELREHHGAAPMVLPPFEFEVRVGEDLGSPVEMVLTIQDPSGGTHVQRLHHSNMREQCDPYCDPVVGGPPCPPRECWMERFRPPPSRIDAEAYRPPVPGVWTFVLHRLDDGERVSVSMRLFEGEALEGEDCEALPVALGSFERAECRRGIVPLGTTTHYWGIKAQYARGRCRVNAFALPLSDAVRSLFHEGRYGAAGERRFAEGAVHELDLDGVVARAWLAHHHLYVVAAPDGLPGWDALVGAFLEIFPDVGGPVRDVPRCEAAGDVSDRTLPPFSLEQLRGDGARFLTHFEGNRPSGARASFHDGHPLALAGLRRGEIVQTVDGRRVRDRRGLDGVLERMTRPGRIHIVVSRNRVSHPRCIRLRVVEGAPLPPADAPDVRPPPPPAPPPAASRRGRHCERRSEGCWDCVEFAFPAEIGCSGGCTGREICVRLDGRDRCLLPTRVCCLEGTDCNTPPGCEGAASSCASSRPGGRHERCTFLSTCPAPLPGR